MRVDWLHCLGMDGISCFSCLSYHERRMLYLGTFVLMQVCRCSAFVPEGHIAKACNWQCKRKREQYTGSCSIACERILVAYEIPRGVYGSCLHIQIAWLHYVVQRVLRALPAETKVDGFPRASS